MQLSHFICRFKTPDSSESTAYIKKGHMKFTLHMPFCFQLGGLSLLNNQTLNYFAPKFLTISTIFSIISGDIFPWYPGHFPLPALMCFTSCSSVFEDWKAASVKSGTPYSCPLAVDR